MNDEALSPVIAVMLILAVAVTIFSVYNAEYMPGLKQQAEAEHLQKVEESMARFGSALENAASLKRTLSMSEPVVLGGGDILLHSARSAGTIRVQQEKDPVVIIWIDNNTDNIRIPLHFINFSYLPMDNFWVDQGYSWQYGYINVSWASGGKLRDPVPLQYSTMEKVVEKKLKNSKLGQSLIHFEYSSEGSNNLTLSAVNMTSGVKNFTSGNGVARFELETEEYEKEYPYVEYLNFSFGDTPFRDLQNWLPLQNKTLGGGNITFRMINITVSTS